MSRHGHPYQLLRPELAEQPAPVYRERMDRMAAGTGERPQGGLVAYRGIWVSRRLAPGLARLDAFAAAAQGRRILWTSGYRSPQEQANLQVRHEAGDPSVPYEPLPYLLSKHATGDAADGEASSPEDR